MFERADPALHACEPNRPQDTVLSFALFIFYFERYLGIETGDIVKSGAWHFEISRPMQRKIVFPLPIFRERAGRDDVSGAARATNAREK